MSGSEVAYVDPVDDNPFRRPSGSAAAAAAVPPGANPLPARPLDAVSGTGMPSSTQPCGCARLAEANATAAHSVNVGADILTMLGTQREQLINTRETLAEQRSALDRGGALVSKMLRRAATNKLVLKGTVVLLIALIIIILVAKYWPQSHHLHS